MQKDKMVLSSPMCQTGEWQRPCSSTTTTSRNKINAQGTSTHQQQQKARAVTGRKGDNTFEQT